MRFLRPYPRWVAGGADSTADASRWAVRTQWTRGQAAPLRAFLLTESGSAGILVGAVAVALVWANVDASSYESVWQTDLSIRLGICVAKMDVCPQPVGQKSVPCT